MTEEQLERQAEASMDALDRQLMSGMLTQKEYDLRVVALDRATEKAWAARGSRA